MPEAIIPSVNHGSRDVLCLLGVLQLDYMMQILLSFSPFL